MTSLTCFIPSPLPSTLATPPPLFPPPRVALPTLEPRRPPRSFPGPSLPGSKWGGDGPTDPRQHAAQAAQLKALASRPPRVRHETLRALSRDTREALLLGPGAGVDHISEALDWPALDLHGTSYHPRRALALAIVSAEAYRAFAQAPSRGEAPPCRGLAEAGFEVRRLGLGTYSARALLAVRGHEVIVAFAGTHTLQDVLRDLDAFQTRGFGGRVHAGMKKSIDEIWGQLELELEALRAGRGEGKPLRIVLTGHSLGGALALLSATRLHGHPGHEVTSVLAFGPPKALDGRARREVRASGLEDRVWRVLMHSDVVHDLPWSPFFGEYEHVGAPIYLDRDGCCRLDASPSEIRDERRGTFRWMELLTRGRQIKPLRDHEASAYVRALYLHHRDVTQKAPSVSGAEPPSADAVPSHETPRAEHQRAVDGRDVRRPRG